MRKFTFILMLLTMIAGASWGQTTENILLSTNVDNPQHVYYMKNGNGRWMTSTTGPTVTWANKAKFAFFAGEKTGTGDESAYKIYCLTSQKWLSYTVAASYNNGVDFVSLVENEADAKSWGVTTKDGNGNLNTVYQFAPYNSTNVAGKYMNWFEGASSNPNDNTDHTVGLYGTDATGDKGSCWIVVDVDFADLIHDRQMVRIRQVNTAETPVYMTITSLVMGNDGGVKLKNKIATSSNECTNQIFYLKSQTTSAACKIQSICSDASKDGYYLQSCASWGYGASTTDGADAAHTIEIADDGYLLRSTKGYVGTNQSQFADGAQLYSNHGLLNNGWGGDGNPKNSIYWTIEPLTEEEVLAASAHVIPLIKQEYKAWVAENAGDNFGQDYVPTENQTAFNAAKNALDNATIATVAEDALNDCKAQYVVHGLIAGKYYRIENTAMDNYYIGLDGYTLNMKHNEVLEETNFDNNPGIIWKCEQDGDKFYLKNVYSGLYPQNIPDGQAATAQIGVGKEKAFTYAIHARPTETVDPKWNIFFGGRQVNCEGSDGNKGNVNYWYEDNAHYYIYEVEAPADEFASMCTSWYTANTKADEDVSGVEKIVVDADASVIISPSEFGAPREINDVIDNYKDKLNLAATGVTQSKIHDMYEALSKWPIVRTYQNAVANNGSLLSVAYTTPNAEYATIILPVNWSLPAGWHRLACSAADGNVLTLENKDGEGTNKNKAYIVQLAEAQRNVKYQFIGYSTGAATTNQTTGWLTGVLEDKFKVPAGSYILSTYNGRQGFFKVADGANYDAVKNKCFLTIPATTEEAARYAALFFDGDTETGIDNVFDAETEQGNGLIYNMAGQRMNGLQKGLNIVNGKIIIK